MEDTGGGGGVLYIGLNSCCCCTHAAGRLESLSLLLFCVGLLNLKGGIFYLVFLVFQQRCVEITATLENAQTVTIVVEDKSMNSSKETQGTCRGWKGLWKRKPNKNKWFKVEMNYFGNYYKVMISVKEKIKKKSKKKSANKIKNSVCEEDWMIVMDTGRSSVFGPWNAVVLDLQRWVLSVEFKLSGVLSVFSIKSLL